MISSEGILAILAPRQHAILFQVSSGIGDSTSLLFLECDYSDTFLCVCEREFSLVNSVPPLGQIHEFFFLGCTHLSFTHATQAHLQHALSEEGEKEEGRRRNGNSSALMLLN